MPEWVDWQYINEHHRYIQQDNESTCLVCGKNMNNHWFSRQNPKRILDEAEQVADEYIRKLLE